MLSPDIHLRNNLFREEIMSLSRNVISFRQAAWTVSVQVGLFMSTGIKREVTHGCRYQRYSMVGCDQGYKLGVHAERCALLSS
jgi:hypothetical protein